MQRSKRETSVTVRAYKKYTLNNLELEQLTLFNPSKIKSYITQFLSLYKLERSFIGFSLVGPSVLDRLVLCTTTTPKAEMFNHFMPKEAIHWGADYLYATEKETFMFHLYGLLHATLLSLQILCIKMNLNVVAILTQRTTLFHVYRFLYGPSFRQSQLAADMAYHNNMIEHIFSTEILWRLIRTDDMTFDTEREAISLLSACGLLLSQERYDER